jgi:hypothetical protein
MSLNGIAALGILLFIVVIFLTVKDPAPSLEGLTAIPSTFPQFTGWSGQHAAVAKIEATDKSSGARVGEFLRGADGRLYESPESAARSTIQLEETPIIPFGQRIDRIGTFVAYFDKHGDTRADRFQVGAHYEPCDLFFGTISLPSFAITKDLAGIGAVGRLPPRTFPRLSCIGIGVWEAAPFDGGRPSLLVGAEFHIALP